MKNIFQLLITSIALMTVINCGGGGGSISVLPTTDAYDETAPINAQMDILWVVDPSRSMRQNVQSVNDNIDTFVSDFVTKGYDFKMGVISTAAWAKLAYDADSTLPSQLSTVFNKFHQGECIGQDTTIPVIDDGSGSSVFEYTELFRKNFDVYGLALNTSGCGLNHLTGYAPVAGNVFDGVTDTVRSKIAEYVNDERPLQSIESFLGEDGTGGNGFLRPNAFLAVIIISDEMDASRTNLSPATAYNPEDPTNRTAGSFISYLDSLKAGDRSKYAVYSIINQDLEGANNNISKLVAEQTGGLAFDIQSTREEYQTFLSQIKGNILTSASVYSFQREPIVASIDVQIIKDGGVLITVPKAPTTGPNSGLGWTFDGNYGAFGGLFFDGEDFIPSEGDEVIVRFTPTSLSPTEVKAPFINISNNSVLEREPIGESVGTISIFNLDVGPNDEVEYTIEDEVNSDFELNSSTGELTTKVIFDAESEKKSLVRVNAVVTRKDSMGVTTGTVPLPPRDFNIAIIDIADTVPAANIINQQFVISDFSGDNVVITGVLSRAVSGMDVSETHAFTFDASILTALNEGIVVNNSATGAFTYTIPKSSISSFPLTRVIPYTVTGSTHNVVGVDNFDSSTLTLTVSDSNSAPEYFNPICPEGGYDYCDGTTVRPNTEGVFFGAIPLTAADITVSGTTGGDEDGLIAGNANFRSGPNAQGAHEVLIEFPDDKIYEVGCVQITRDDNSSLGNIVYQVLTPDATRPVTREVIPVGIGTSRSNFKNAVQPGAQGACNTLSTNYFTIYTAGRFIGGGIKIIRPSGSLNAAGHADLRLDQIRVFGIEAKFNEIPLEDHFRDLDGDNLTYIITDAFGEGPGPGWASIDNGTKTLNLLPPTSVNEFIGIIAQDGTEPGSKEAFVAIKVVGSGGESTANSAPISLLALDDAKRGGISLKRFGGGQEVANPLLDNSIRHGEGDNFIIDPYAGQDLRDAIVDSGLCTPATEAPLTNATGTCDLQSGTYQTNPNTTIPEDIRDLLPINQIAHFGDTYGRENGWSTTPIYVNDKYPQGASTYCNQSVAANGRINPCINTTRAYGETYTGYFVPAQTGVYRFRSSTPVDDIVRLLMAPTEYVEDLMPVITSNHTGVNNLTASLYNILGDARVANQEFSPNNHPAAGHDTSIFYKELYEAPAIPLANQGSYRKGYTYLKQGNVYAFEIRFQEGAGDVRFAFEYNRKDLNCDPNNASPTGSCWDGWAAMDTSILVPSDGDSAHTPLVIPVASNVVSFNASTLFYDAELDVLDYTARLVTPNGDVYNDGSIAQIGLSINLLSGQLTGTLANMPAQNKPRIVIKAKERRFGGQETESLPIKFEE